MVDHIHQRPPWADAPRLEYRLFKDRVKMARSYCSFMVNLKRLLLSKSDTEPGGTIYVRELEILVDGRDHKSYIHEIPQMPTKKLPTKHDYFIVVVYPPPDLGDGDMPLDGVDKVVELLFSANSLYHLGFSCDMIWYVFKDAILKGVEEQDEASFNIRRLKFKGSYQDIELNFDTLTIGFNGQLETYRTLVNKFASQKELIIACCRNIVTISESSRFPFLLQLHLTSFQLGYFDALLNSPVKKGEEYRNVSAHFTDWSSYSGKCREGKEKFDAVVRVTQVPGIPTFDCLLNFVALLSNKDHLKPDKDDKYMKHNEGSVSNQDNDKKEGDDKDLQKDKDVNDKEKQVKTSSASVWFFEAPVMPYASGHWIRRRIAQGAEIFFVKEDETPCIFGLTVKHAWSYACATQIIDRLIFVEVVGNDLNFTIVRPFDWIGPRMDIIADDGVREGVPACFRNNFLCREPLNLLDCSKSQRTLVCTKDASEAVLLMIVKHCLETNNRLIHFSTCEVYSKTISSFLPKDHPLRKGLHRRERLKLVDRGESQRTFHCMNDANEAVRLMIENPARANGHIFSARNPSKVTVGIG